MFDIIILGAGGFAREVYHWAHAAFPKSEYRIKGFYSKNPAELDGWSGEARIIGHEDQCEIGQQDRFLMAIGVMEIRKRVAASLKRKGAQFLTLIHPTAIVAGTATIGEGAILCPYVIVSDNVSLGEFVLMNLYASCGHDARVGSFSVLAPYSILTGYAAVESEVFLGSHVTVAPGKTVGSQSKVCANSLVLRNVPPRTFVHGVPGKNEPIF